MTSQTYVKMSLMLWLLFIFPLFMLVVPCYSQNSYKNLGKCSSFQLKSPSDRNGMNTFVHNLNYTHIERYTMFFGAPRTGQSWIGSVLDAAPDALVANELNALDGYLHGRIKTQEALFQGLAKNSYVCGKLGRYQIHNYTIPGLWQGKVASNKTLRVIGDKKGSASTYILQGLSDESAWENIDAANIQKQFFSDFLNNVVQVEPRFILVLRNPFDIIATNVIEFQRSSKNLDATENMIKPKVSSSWVNRILGNLRENMWIQQNLVDPHQFYVMTMERFEEETREEMSKLCDFLGITCPIIMLEKVEKQTHQYGHHSFLEVDWPDDLFDEVNEFVKEFLSDYYDVQQNPNLDADE